MVQPEKRLLWHPRHENKFIVGGGSQITLYDWQADQPEIRQITSHHDLQHLKVLTFLTTRPSSSHPFFLVFCLVFRPFARRPRRRREFDRKDRHPPPGSSKVLITEQHSVQQSGRLPPRPQLALLQRPRLQPRKSQLPRVRLRQSPRRP